MKFSLLTCCFNSSSTIKCCVQSVYHQSYPEIEHIIIDGLSTDDTLKIIKSVPNRISRIISEPDSGIYSALNKGIKVASGEIIGIVHSDDELASVTVIEEIAAKFKESLSDVVYGDLNYVSARNNDRITRTWKSNPYDKSLVIKGWMPAHPATFIRREIFNKYGMYDQNFRISSDYDLLIRLMQIEELSIDYLPIVVTRMRTGGVSNNSLRNIIRKSSEDYQIIKKNGIPNPAAVLIRKNVSKLAQFFH